jgi:hypothetical protein
VSKEIEPPIMQTIITIFYIKVTSKGILKANLRMAAHEKTIDKTTIVHGKTKAKVEDISNLMRPQECLPSLRNNMALPNQIIIIWSTMAKKGQLFTSWCLPFTTQPPPPSLKKRFRQLARMVKNKHHRAVVRVQRES